MVLNLVDSSRPTLTWGSFAIKFPYIRVPGLVLSKPQKVILVSVSIGVGLLAFLSKYLRRRKRGRPPAPTRQDSTSLHRRFRAGIRSPNRDVLTGFQTASPVPQRMHRTRSGSVNSDRYASLVNEIMSNKPGLSPQQLGTMGVESLEAAIGYWEEALDAYQSGSGVAALPSAEEADFCRSLEVVLKAAYALQDETEHLFLHQHSVLFQSEPGTPSGNQTPFSKTSHSFTSADSFVSAQGEVADLQDFTDLPIDDSLPLLYQGALKQLDEHGIPCRTLRTELTSCESDIEYLCKLHCVRLSCQVLFRNEEALSWFASAGRSLLSNLITLADKDPHDVQVAYDAILVLCQDPCHKSKIAAELEGRGVRALTFYDVVLDFILMDAFEDLTTPPSSVVAVINNRWLSNGFKEGALATAVWSVLKAKRRKLMFADGFISHFYDINEHLSPVLAWGFLGPESRLRTACFFFKDQVIGFLQDIFSFERARYSSVEDMSHDVWLLAKQRHQAVIQHMNGSC